MTLEAISSPNPSEKHSHVVQQEYKIMAEYKMLQSENLSGLYTIPSYASSLEWFGVLFVREDGIYKDGVFRFRVILPPTFPEDSTAVPEINFDHPPFHPLICPYTGLLNTCDAFPDWNMHENHIWQLLKYIQYVFDRPEMCLSSITVHDKEAKINRVAMETLEDNKAEFAQKVKESMEACKEKLYAKPAKADRHYIVFEKFDDDVHGPVLDSIKARKDISIASPPTSGLSWVNNDGDFKPLSKPEE